MTVKELKDWLEELNDNTIVLFRPENSNYVYNFESVKTKDISAFWGDDYTALVFSGEQVGGC